MKLLVLLALLFRVATTEYHLRVNCVREANDRKWVPGHRRQGSREGRRERAWGLVHSDEFHFRHRFLCTASFRNRALA